MNEFEIAEIEPADRDALSALWTARYGTPVVVSRGKLHDPRTLPGFKAVCEGEFVGAVTLRRDGDEAEIVTLDSLREDRGAGSALLEWVALWAEAQGLRRLWLVTTNDNTRAIRFYQKRGWTMVALHRDAVFESRKLKLEIPTHGADGIPIRHEIEFELLL